MAFLFYFGDAVGRSRLLPSHRDRSNLKLSLRLRMSYQSCDNPNHFVNMLPSEQILERAARDGPVDM